MLKDKLEQQVRLYCNSDLGKEHLSFIKRFPVQDLVDRPFIESKKLLSHYTSIKQQLEYYLSDKTMKKDTTIFNNLSLALAKKDYELLISLEQKLEYTCKELKVSKNEDELTQAAQKIMMVDIISYMTDISSPGLNVLKKQGMEVVNDYLKGEDDRSKTMFLSPGTIYSSKEQDNLTIMETVKGIGKVLVYGSSIVGIYLLGSSNIIPRTIEIAKEVMDKL